MKKTIILTIDLQGVPDWQKNAMQMQVMDWVNANKSSLPFSNLVILPTTGDTRLYWLEGEVGNPKDVKELESLRDKFKPLLEVALDLKIDKEKLFNRPANPELKKAVDKLKELRQK